MQLDSLHRRHRAYEPHLAHVVIVRLAYGQSYGEHRQIRYRDNRLGHGHRHDRHEHHRDHHGGHDRQHGYVGVVVGVAQKMKRQLMRHHREERNDVVQTYLAYPDKEKKLSQSRRDVSKVIH